MCHMCTPHLTLLKPSPPEQHQQTTTLHCPSPRTQQCSCFYVGGWEGGCTRGWEGGGGGKGCARNGWWVPHKSESPPPLLPCSAEPPCSTVLDAECFGTWWCEHLAKEKEWGWLSVPCAPGWGLPNARPCPHSGVGGN